MKTILKKENEISLAQKQYRDKANKQYISNENKVKRQGLWKKLALSDRELTLLNDSVEAATCKYHRIAADKYIKTLENLVSDHKSIEKATKSVNIELNHLQTQIIRLEQARNKLEKDAVSDDQYAMDLKRANTVVRILENRLYGARHKENYFKVNIIRLQYLIRALCVDRIKFNKLWVKIVDRLALDKKMLRDMTDQAVIAFEKGSEFRKRIDMVTKNAMMVKNDQIDEMTAILRSLHMDRITETFFGNKMHRIEMKPLDAKEVRRRSAFRQYHNDTQIAYEMTLNEVKSKAGRTKVDVILEEFAKQKREYFAQFCYLNDLQMRVMQMNAILMKVKIQANEGKSKQVPIKQRKKAKLLRESTFNHAKMDNQEKAMELTTLNESMDRYRRELTNLVETMHCEPKNPYLIKELENDVVQDHNIRAFLSEIEQHLRQIISFVYYLEWKKTELAPQTSKVVQGIDVINYHLNEFAQDPMIHQCAECAMDAEASGHDAQVPLDIAVIREAMLVKALTPELAYRMHNISQCDLPASRALLAKSMQ